jgi:hypothetical protein
MANFITRWDPFPKAVSLRDAMDQSTIDGDTLTIKGERPAPIENSEYVLLECT